MAKQAKSVHGLILGLLFTILVASLGVLTLVFLMDKDEPSESELVAMCARQAAASAATATQSITNACDDDEDTVELESFAPSPSWPGFSYPADWSAMSKDDDASGQLANTVYLNEEIIYFCMGCDGPLLPITMVTQEIKLTTIDNGGPVASFDAFATKYYQEPTIYTDLETSKTTVGTGTLYTYKGHQDALHAGDFETLIYQGTEKWVRVTYVDVDSTETETNEAWEVVKESLDFSLIP